MRQGSWITNRVYVEREPQTASNGMDLVTIHIGGFTVASFLCLPADAARIEGLAKAAQDVTALRQAYADGADAVREAVAEGRLEYSQYLGEWRGTHPDPEQYQP